MTMNVDVLNTINGWSGTPVVDAVMRFAAQDLIFVVFAIAAVLLVVRLVHRQLRPVVLVALSLAVAYLLGLAAAALHPELRPFQIEHLHVLVAHAPGQSFPSDHATASFAIAFAVLIFVSRRWGLLLVLAAALVGFARVYDGIHYPADVLGSLAIAGVATLLVMAATTASSHGRSAGGELTAGRLQGRPGRS
jgi:undecaprenyl-diphosphatase